MFGRRGRKRIPVKTFTILMHDVDRAVTDGEEEGFVKIHVREGTDRILGATVVARHAGEMINGLSLAINSGIGLRALARVIHTYPTQAEAIKMAADAYNRTRLTPTLKSLTKGAGWHGNRKYATKPPMEKHVGTPFHRAHGLRTCSRCGISGCARIRSRFRFRENWA